MRMDGPLSECLPWAPKYPWAEAEVQYCSGGFEFGYSKSDESSHSCHTQGHASNNGHAHQSIFFHGLVNEPFQFLGLVVLGLCLQQPSHIL